MSSIANSQASEQAMPVPETQDVLEPLTETRDRWLDKAAFALYEARRAEFPEAYPLPWEEAPQAIRRDFRYSIMGAYRRNLPYVRDVLIELTAMQLANLDGWVYPDCDNKREMRAYDQVEGNAIIAQRRQRFRHNARTIVSAFFRHLEIDTDTEAQRKQTLDIAAGQMHLDATAVSMWRRRKGIPIEVNRG